MHDLKVSDSKGLTIKSGVGGMTSFAKAYREAFTQPAFPVIWAVLSVFGIMAGPFGTFIAISFWARLLFWPVVVALAMSIGTALRVYIRNYLGLTRYRSEAPVLALLAVLVLTPPCLLLTRIAVADSVPPPSWSDVALYILVASGAASTLRHAILYQTRAAAAAGEPGSDIAEETDPPRLLARIEPELRAEVVRLQTRDHYVDVVTRRGKTSLLMRFADAMGELEGVEGLQVHRSHWVALGEVQAVRRSGGKVSLEMRDGSLVPVSRTHQPAVTALGLEADGAPEVAAAE